MDFILLLNVNSILYSLADTFVSELLLHDCDSQSGLTKLNE